MRQRSGIATHRFALAASTILLCLNLAGQNAAPPSLQEQLKAQYKLVKMGVDGSGLTVVEPGTVLDIQKGGLLGIPPQITMFCPAKFQDGDLKAPNAFCAGMVRQNSRLLQVGTKVYPLKIDVNLDKDKVSFQVVECDSCNGVQQPSFYKSEVVFQFAKGSLHNASVPDVEDTIGKVLSIDSGGDSQQSNDQAGQNQGGQNQGNSQGNNQGGGGGGQTQQQAPPAEPQQIEKGQSPDQVKSALGNPDKIVNLGAKQIYVYKDLKVTFLNGKVSDVQ
jgi:hypothetical protein